MTACLILLGALLLVGAVLKLTHRPAELQQEANEPRGEHDVNGEFCCGTHAVCEKINTRILEPVEYFDDEELDRFKGRTETDYTNPEIDEFREVMLTLLPSDVASWSVSLEKRGIKLPQPLRDELMILLFPA